MSGRVGRTSSGARNGPQHMCDGGGNVYVRTISAIDGKTDTHIHIAGILFLNGPIWDVGNVCVCGGGFPSFCYALAFLGFSFFADGAL